MRRITRGGSSLLRVGVLVVAASSRTSTSFAASAPSEVRVAIMTDCKGAFGFGYELDIGGAQACVRAVCGRQGRRTRRSRRQA